MDPESVVDEPLTYGLSILILLQWVKVRRPLPKVDDERPRQRIVDLVRHLRQFTKWYISRRMVERSESTDPKSKVAGGQLSNGLPVMDKTVKGSYLSRAAEGDGQGSEGFVV